MQTLSAFDHLYRGSTAKKTKEKLKSKQRKLLDQQVSVLYSLLRAYVMPVGVTISSNTSRLLAQQQGHLDIGKLPNQWNLADPKQRIRRFFHSFCSNDQHLQLANVFSVEANDSWCLAVSEIRHTPTMAIFFMGTMMILPVDLGVPNVQTLCPI